MLTTIYEDSWLWVPWAVLDKTRLGEDLVIRNEQADKARSFQYRDPGETRVVLWEDAGDWVKLPRGYSPPFLPGVRVQRVKRRPPPQRAPFWTMHRELRENQHDAAHALETREGDKLLCMGCGKGKTTLALWYASRKAQKTIIIVDRDFLVDQWREEIAACLHIPVEEIGLVQGKSRTIGEKLTIAVVNTLAQQEFPNEFYLQFGLVIVDEAHVMAAPTFSHVVPAFVGERLLLTATPFRRDGLYPVFMLHAGGLQPCYTDLARTQSTRWYFKKLPPVSGLVGERELARCYRRLPRGRVTKRVVNGKMITEHQQMLVRPKYDTLFSNSITATTFILNEVGRAHDTGRNVLFLGNRVEWLEYAHGYFQASGADSGLITGEVTGAKRREAFGHQTLFITDKIGNRALDVPRLDTLYLLTPTDDEGWIRQAVGRIDREHEGKRSPIAVVFWHTGVPSLERKGAVMIDKIRNIDPNAVIQYV